MSRRGRGGPRRGRGGARSGTRRRRPRTGNARVMAWSDVDSFEPRVLNFDREGNKSGIQDEFPILDDDAEELEYFEAFFDDGVTELVCRETNRFYAQTSVDDPDDPSPSTSRSRKKKWVDLEPRQFFVFMALLMLMSHMKKAVLKDYWLVDNIVSTPVFGKYMARDRFLDILRYIHFADNTTEQERKRDRLWKIRDFFSLLKDKFSRFFFPFQKLVIDESLVLFRGRVSFRQYIPSK